MFHEVVLLIVAAVIAVCMSGCKPVMFVVMIIATLMLTMTQYHVPYKPGNAVSAGAANLKKTPNPRVKREEEEETKPEVPVPSSKYDIKEYTPDGMNEKMQDLVFKRSPSHRQTSESRTRLLNSMYSDLVNESLKKDPYLRTSGSTGCESNKGQKTFEWHDDC